MSVKLPDLPKSDDEYWEGANTSSYTARKVKLCDVHEYIDNKDGTTSCTNCPFGVRLPGYLKIHDGKIIDLRRKTSK